MPGRAHRALRGHLRSDPPGPRRGGRGGAGRPRPRPDAAGGGQPALAEAGPTGDARPRTGSPWSRPRAGRPARASRPSRIEIDRGGPSYTIDTVRQLLADRAGCRARAGGRGRRGGRSRHLARARGPARPGHPGRGGPARVPPADPPAGMAGGPRGRSPRSTCRAPSCGDGSRRGSRSTGWCPTPSSVASPSGVCTLRGDDCAADAQPSPTATHRRPSPVPRTAVIRTGDDPAASRRPAPVARLRGGRRLGCARPSARTGPAPTAPSEPRSGRRHRPTRAGRRGSPGRPAGRPGASAGGSPGCVPRWSPCAWPLPSWW